MNGLTQNTGKTTLQLEPEQLKGFFINHLNRVYCAKAHLMERLPELVLQASFGDIKHAILETYEDIDRQIVRMQEIYPLLETVPDLESCEELTGFIEDGFNEIYRLQNEEPALRDLSILFYLSVVESVEIASFQVLQMAAHKFPARIRQLLQENFDETKADRLLFLQITSKYVC